jgi:hypothetical protein
MLRPGGPIKPVSELQNLSPVDKTGGDQGAAPDSAYQKEIGLFPRLHRAVVPGNAHSPGGIQGQHPYHREIMARHDHGNREFSLYPLDKVQYPGLYRKVKAGSYLVQKEEGWVILAAALAIWTRCCIPPEKFLGASLIRLTGTSICSRSTSVRFIIVPT